MGPEESTGPLENVILCGCDRDAGVQTLFFVIGQQGCFTSKLSLQPHSTFKKVCVCV